MQIFFHIIYIILTVLQYTLMNNATLRIWDRDGRREANVCMSGIGNYRGGVY